MENARDEWQKRVLDYVRLLSASPLAADRRLASEERNASQVFSAYIKARHPKTARHGWALMQQMVSKYPRSVFTLAAINQSGSIYWWCSEIAEEQDRALRFFMASLKSLEKANTPARHRIVVLNQLALEADDVMQPTAWRHRIGYETQRQIEKLSDLPSQKAAALFAAAKLVSEADEKDARPRSRALFYEVIQKYPRTSAATEARRSIIKNWLMSRQTDKALQAIYAFEPRTPAAEIAELLLHVARSLDGEIGNPEALPVLEEVARRFPRQGTASEANVRIAAIYGKRGEEAKMLTLYEKVATLKKGDVDGGEGYLYEAQSSAIARLGAYYMKTKNWEEALKWWRGWKSASFCGNCAESQNSANTYRIYNCLTKLGREAEAVQTLEEWTFKSHIESEPEVPVALVESYRRLGELSTLETKLRAAMEKNKYLTAAQMARDYIGLLRAKERRDIAALWKPFDHKSHRALEYLQWQTKYGAKFLIELGEDAKPFLLGKAKSPPKNKDDETADASSWACLLLAQLKAAEALPILKEKLKTIKSAQELKYRFWALAILNSDESRAILERHATGNKDRWQVMASKTLSFFPRDTPVAFLASQEQLLNSGPGLDHHWDFNEYLEDEN
jgi:hypothetical protein